MLALCTSDTMTECLPTTNPKCLRERSRHRNSGGSHLLFHGYGPIGSDFSIPAQPEHCSVTSAMTAGQRSKNETAIVRITHKFLWRRTWGGRRRSQTQTCRAKQHDDGSRSKEKYSRVCHHRENPRPNAFLFSALRLLIGVDTATAIAKIADDLYGTDDL